MFLMFKSVSIVSYCRVLLSRCLPCLSFIQLSFCVSSLYYYSFVVDDDDVVVDDVVVDDVLVRSCSVLLSIVNSL